MINEQKLLVLLLFSIFLMSSVSAICAADSNMTDVPAVDNEDIELEQTDLNQDDIQQSDSDEERIAGGNPKSFSYLNHTINGNNDSLVVLDDDYSYNADSDSAFLMGITIGRSVTIDGNGHTIDGCSNSAKGFNTGSFAVLFKNIYFVNLGKTDNSNYNGGAIYSTGSATKAQNCEFIGCKGYGGGAVYYAAVDNCTFKGCMCSNSNSYGGAAVYTFGTVSNCYFENNGGSSSYGVLANGTAINCTFKNNQGSEGGAIYSGNAINSTFIGNKAYSGGAIGGYDWCAVNCTFINNTASYGGAVYAYQDSSGLKRGYAVGCYFENNRASYGGAIYRSVSALCTFKTSSDNYNNCEFPSVSMKSSTVSGNYPSVSLPLELYYYNTRYIPSSFYPGNSYYFKDVNLTLTVSKNGQSVGTYQGLSGKGYVFNLEPGTYTVSVSLTNPSAHGSTSISSNTYTLIVNGYKSVINATDLEIEYNNTSNLTVTLKGDYYGTPLINKTLNVFFNGNSSTAKTDENGQITIDIPKLPAKTYPIEIYFSGDGVYESCSKIVNVTVDKIGTELSSGNVSAFYNEGKIVAKLTDKDGNLMIGSYVSLSLAYLHPTLKTNGSGEVVFDLEGLAEGNYTAEIRFGIDPVYADSTVNINVNIYRLISEISAGNIEYIYTESGILTAYLKDCDQKPIENAIIELVVDKYYDALKTNADGRVDFNLSGKLGPGKFSANLYFDMTNRYRASSIPVNITVNRIPTEISAPDVTCIYGDEKYFAITLKDKYGNPLANESVSVKLSIKTLTGKTDENGQAKFLIDLAPKTYVATVSFSGNSTHMSNSSMFNIAVNQLTSRISTEITGNNLNSFYNDGKQVTITLRDAYGNIMGNRPVSIDFNGKTKSYITDNDGQIKLSTSSLLPKTYHVKITFAGSKRYREFSLSLNIVVKKANPSLFTSKKKFNVKSPKKFKVALKTNKNVAMKKVKLYLKVNGKTYTAKTNKKGQATFKLNKLTKKGTYNAVVTYNGNNCYNKVTKTAKVIIK